ncbi:hypothetical protein [Massilia varians]|nr:hypothetical protein [Massilia varians]
MRTGTDVFRMLALGAGC